MLSQKIQALKWMTHQKENVLLGRRLGRNTAVVVISPPQRDFGSAVVAVVVSDELATAIGTQVLKEKSERHDDVLHEFDQSRQHFVLRRDDVYRFELDVIVGILGHEAAVPSRRGRHGTQEVGADELKPPRDLGLTRLVANWLFGAVVDLVNVTRGQRVREIDSDVPCGLHGELVRMPEALVPEVLVRMSQALMVNARSPPPPWQLSASPV